MNRKRILAVLALCSAAPALGQTNATPKTILVNRTEFECLIDNIDRVPSEPRGVFVDIRDCRREGIKVIRHLIAPPPQADPDGAEYLLFLKPRQLKCIKSNRKRVDRIARPASGNRYGLKIDPCGGR
jgi:hypothetical protein